MSATRLAGSARALALEIVAEVRSEWGFASEVIARSFRAHRELPSQDRRRISDTVYGLIRMDRRLDAILEALGSDLGSMLGRGARGRLGLADLGPTARDELKLLVFEAREGIPPEALQAEADRLFGARVDIARAADAEAGLAGRDGLDREAVRLSYPTWMLEMFVADLGRDRALAVAAAMSGRAPMAIRVNTARITREALIARLAEENVVARPTTLASSGLVLETRVNAFGLSAFRDGLFEVMDEGSQLVAELIAPPPGGRVVDACAGAGGKTLAIGAAMGGRGRLLALDVDGKKLEELRRRARRAGLTNVTARPVDEIGTLTGSRNPRDGLGRAKLALPHAKETAGMPEEARASNWDRVLVDAPCSGLGTLRRNPEARWRLTAQTVHAFPARQVALLVTYAPLCAVGGRLIYATCTLAEEENDRVVERFLAERDDFVRVPVKEIWGRARAETLGDGLTLRLYPDQHDTDAFFAAVMRRVR